MKSWIANLSEQEAKEQLERADNLLFALAPLGLASESLPVTLLMGTTYCDYVAVAVDAAGRE